LALRECFRRWGLGLEATCYWLKVTRYGELVTPYSGGKQPYEVLLVGRREGEGGASAIQVPEGLVIVSVPSGIHSHKPPLVRVLEKLVVEEEGKTKEEVVAGLRKLEVFGRSLLPGWHTVGLQPCLLNMLP